MERRVGGGGRGGEREMDREDMKGGRTREERGGGRRWKQEGMKQAHIKSALRGAGQGHCSRWWAGPAAGCGGGGGAAAGQGGSGLWELLYTVCAT